MNTKSEKVISDDEADQLAEQMTEIVNDVVAKVKPQLVAAAEKVDLTSGRIGIMVMASTVLYADMLEATIRLEESGDSNGAPAQFVAEQFAHLITERMAKIMYMANIPDAKSRH